MADRLGYRLAEEPMARTELHAPINELAPRVGSKLGRVYGPLLFEGEDTKRARRAHAGRPFRTGQWGVAVLSRVPVVDTTILSLGKLRRRLRPAGGHPLRPRDRRPTHRRHRDPHVPSHPGLATASTAGFAGCSLQPRQPAVLAGDMNLWGPPVAAAFPGLAARRARPDLAGRSTPTASSTTCW